MSHRIPILFQTHVPWHGVEHPLSCGHDPLPDARGTGVAITSFGQRICFRCADELEVA